MSPEDWQRYHAANRAPWVPRDSLLAEEVAGLRPGKALELGCGEGSDALYLARLGFDVLATDVAPAALEITTARSADQALPLRTLLMDAVSLRLPETFQLIYMGFLALPGPEIGAVLEQVYDHLDIGGTFLYIGLLQTGSPEEITGHLSPLKFERAETIQRVISMPNEEDFLADCVVVRARREVL